MARKVCWRPALDKNCSMAKRYLPTAYASYILTPTEQNYVTNEWEALAVLWALENWEHFLHFQLHSDHKPLAALIQQCTHIVETVEQLKWNRAGHLARIKDNRWTIRVTKWTPLKNKRSKGKQKIRWPDEMARNEMARNSWECKLVPTSPNSEQLEFQEGFLLSGCGLFYEADNEWMQASAKNLFVGQTDCHD